MFDYFNKPALDDAINAGKEIRFSHNPEAYGECALKWEWDYLQEKHGYFALEKKEIFGMQPTNYEFLDKIADVFLSQRECGNNNELIDTVSFYDNKMSSIVYDYYPFEVEIRDNNLYFFIITNRSEKKIMFSSSLNTDFDKLCDSLIKCIMTDVKKQIPKKFLKAKGFL